MDIYTIGFTRWSAEGFFGALRENGIQRLIDVRAHNVSQLAGFAKRDDLKFFLKEIAGAEYIHEPLLAPTGEMLKQYRSTHDWDSYRSQYLELMEARGIERLLGPSDFEKPTVLLCSERTQERCHRRLVVEYLDRKWGDVTSLPI